MGDNGKKGFTAADQVAECTYGGNELTRLVLGLAYSSGSNARSSPANKFHYTYCEEGGIILTGGRKRSHGYPVVTGSPYAPHARDTRLVIWCTVVMWGPPKPCGLGRVGVVTYLME